MNNHIHKQKTPEQLASGFCAFCGLFVSCDRCVCPHDRFFQFGKRKGFFSACGAKLINQERKVFGVFSDAFISFCLVCIRRVVDKVVLNHFCVIAVHSHHPFLIIESVVGIGSFFMLLLLLLSPHCGVVDVGYSSASGK